MTMKSFAGTLILALGASAVKIKINDMSELLAQLDAFGYGDYVNGTYEYEGYGCDHYIKD